VLGGAARHQAVAVGLDPDAAGFAAVDVADPLNGQEHCLGRVVRIAGVPAVDHEVARLEVVRE
jgi:hypothetical protein